MELTGGEKLTGLTGRTKTEWIMVGIETSVLSNFVLMPRQIWKAYEKISIYKKSLKNMFSIKKH